MNLTIDILIDQYDPVKIKNIQKLNEKYAQQRANQVNSEKNEAQ